MEYSEIRILSLWIIVFQLSGIIAAIPTLTVPSAGNCGDDTVLTCQHTGGLLTSWKWIGLDRPLITNGVINRPNDTNKYSETINNSTAFSLTIMNTSYTDAGSYRCEIGFNRSVKMLNFECKAKTTSSSAISEAKKLELKFTDIYPAASNVQVTLTNTSPSTVPGSQRCSSTSTFSYTCDWTSTSSLADGDYTYSVTVTTVTASSPLTGTFRIVTPLAPTIFNKETISNSREVVRGVEGQSVTLTCTSTGGTPEPTVAWYRDSISTTAVATTSTGIQQGDGTYTVKLTYTVASVDRTRDDRKTFLCRSYYPLATTTATQGSNTSSVLMYLALKPSAPTVTQTAAVTSGQSVTVECQTSNCRPAANISWVENEQITTPQVTSREDTMTETFTVISMFRKTVTAADNGQTVQCEVTHEALGDTLTQNISLNVTFTVLTGTTRISGNREMTANGITSLTLNCTTGSSNPAADITWKNGTTTIPNSALYTVSSGDNNGVVRSQQLVLYPTRYMDGDMITCSVSNSPSQIHDTRSETLNLKYNPIVVISTEDPEVFTEGDTTNTVLTCSAESNPPSTFIWYQNNNEVSRGFASNNVFNYNLGTVSRMHYGTYKCMANNNIAPNDEKQITVQIKFKPLTVNISDNSNIIADGIKTLTLQCSSGTSNPISDITWKVNSVSTASTGSLNDEDGQYGGKIQRKQLMLKPTRDNDEDVISCFASNTLSNGYPATQSVTLDLRYNPQITNMADITVVEGQPSSLLTCVASSKPPSSFIWYRGSNKAHEGVGTSANNRLVFTISNITRNQADTYRCNAKNNIGTDDNKNVKLIVQYPPDVRATTTNITVHASSVDVICNANGVPNNNYKYRGWIQTWNDYGEVAQWSQTPTLTLTQLTYKHSGTYRCSASNGVKVYGTNTEYMEGSVTLLVKSFPIITSPILLVGEEKHKVPAEINIDTPVVVKFYLNTDIDLNVTCHKKINGTRQSKEEGTINLTTTRVILPVFTHNVTTNGTMATVTLRMTNQEDFGDYDIVILNEIDATVLPLEVIALGPPTSPMNLSIGTIEHQTAVVTWIRGFHGGLDQTFVIQVSTDNSTWTSTTQFVDGMVKGNERLSTVIKSLSPSTQYYVRMFAMNSKGKSEYTNVIVFKTQDSDPVDTPSVAAVVGGTVGGSVVALVVAVLVVFLVRKHRSNHKGKSNDVEFKGRQNSGEHESDEDETIENPGYVSADEVAKSRPQASGSTFDTYALVDKSKKAPLLTQDVGDIYAKVDKPKKTEGDKTAKTNAKDKGKKPVKDQKKGKKGRKENKTVGDIYENAPPAAINGAHEENLYENPEASVAQQRPKINKNHDGLIYLDIAFKEDPKEPGKLVIHGLDDMTEYSMVDFTKQAEPLPESDEEDQNANKK